MPGRGQPACLAAPAPNPMLWCSTYTVVGFMGTGRVSFNAALAAVFIEVGRWRVQRACRPWEDMQRRPPAVRWCSEELACGMCHAVGLHHRPQACRLLTLLRGCTPCRASCESQGLAWAAGRDRAAVQASVQQLAARHASALASSWQAPPRPWGPACSSRPPTPPSPPSVHPPSPCSFMLVTILGVRSKLVEFIPRSVMLATAAGIGARAQCYVAQAQAPGGSACRLHGRHACAHCRFRHLTVTSLPSYCSLHQGLFLAFIGERLISCLHSLALKLPQRLCAVGAAIVPAPTIPWFRSCCCPWHRPAGVRGPGRRHLQLGHAGHAGCARCAVHAEQRMARLAGSVRPSAGKRGSRRRHSAGGGHSPGSLASLGHAYHCCHCPCPCLQAAAPPTTGPTSIPSPQRTSTAARCASWAPTACLRPTARSSSPPVRCCLPAERAVVLWQRHSRSECPAVKARPSARLPLPAGCHSRPWPPSL